MKTLGIVGGGRAAWAFGSTWRRIGWPLAGVALRSDSPIAELLDVPRRTAAELADEADLLLLAVSDRAIAEVSEQVPQEAKAIVVHASGSLPSIRGGFSLHPLRALPPVGAPSDLRDTLLVFEGHHKDVAQQVAEAAGARFAEIAAADKPRYHAAAVFGSNYIAAMLEIANRVIGIDAHDDLVALAHSAVENWGAHSDRRRFTGPASRGDAATMARHLEALAGDPQLAAIYKLLADQIAGSILATDD